MNKVTAINNLNQTELEQGIAGTTASWHHKYLSSDAIYIGGLSPSITENKLLAILEQYGTVRHINLVRDAVTSESKGYAFVRYADPRSCVLAVDNFTGVEIEGRNLRVDHVENYRMPEDGGMDTTPDGFLESHQQDLDVEHTIAPSPVENAAERRRQAAVMERLEALRKRRRLEASTQDERRDAQHRPSDLHEREHRAEGSMKSSERNLVPDDSRKPNESDKHARRAEKEKRRQEKEKRRQERAKIREQRAQRRAQRNQGSHG
ncbi:RNA-binding motif protein, X-linked 2 [Gracilariopsis chorda]|uniref:RNA-binding motif protein, X-linked 2 n=1 Tax=Gracilariopsis chorda TaxID=448386 RepID=A0A2V3J3N6_9FLOR|nr:RNA-binding motif protein, X-linked 2 [Gracilariopsis chorda]|eukprot:PXF49005.1 RNA-binding motif protein, X-linked 2 [Gracilariopsis chorda]